MPEIGIFNWMKDSEIKAFNEALVAVAEISNEDSGTLDDLVILTKSATDGEIEAIKTEKFALEWATEALGILQSMRRAGRW